MTYNMIRIVWLASLGILIFSVITNSAGMGEIVIVLAIISGAQFYVLRSTKQGELRKAAIINIGILWAAVAYGTYLSGGAYASAIMVFLIPLILSALLLTERFTFGMTALTLIYIVFLILWEIDGNLPYAPAKDFEFRLMIVSVTFIGVVSFFVFHMQKMREADSENIDLTVRAERFQVQAQLTQDLAHDIRTPMTGLSLQIYLLKRHYENGADLGTQIERLEKFNENMSRMVEDLFQLLQLETIGESETSDQVVNLNQLLDQVFESQRDYAAQHGIDLQPITHVPHHLLVVGNSRQLRRLFENLIENAIRYSKEDGFVKSAFAWDETYARVMIIDNGIGISKEYRERIFDRFYRVDTSRHRDLATGTGIGLAIVKRIVELHHGRVFVESSEDQGSKFIVELPLYEVKSLDLNDSQDWS